MLLRCAVRVNCEPGSPCRFGLGTLLGMKLRHSLLPIVVAISLCGGGCASVSPKEVLTMNSYVLDYDTKAAPIYARLKQTKIRVGTMDLKIAVGMTSHCRRMATEKVEMR